MKATKVRNGKEDIFLVKRTQDDGTECFSLMEPAVLAEYINFNDIYNELFEIWQLTGPEAFEECHYAGWQPGGLIEVIRDSDGEVVVKDYGEDH